MKLKQQKSECAENNHMKYVVGTAPTPPVLLTQKFEKDGRFKALNEAYVRMDDKQRAEYNAGKMSPAQLSLIVRQVQLEPSDVLVVGGGMAGVSAAQELMRKGLSVTILEASDHAGGRAVTDTKTFSVPFDLGCSRLHASPQNPLTPLVRELGFTTRLNNQPTFVYGAPESPAIAGRALEKAQDAVMQKVGDAAITDSKLAYQPKTQYEKMALGKLATIERGVYAPKLSTADWFFSPARGVGDRYVKEGLGTFVKKLSEGLPIVFNAPVSQITHDAQGVEVSVGDTTYRAKAIIVTAPPVALAKIAFSPPLSEARRQALASVHRGYRLQVAMHLSRRDFPDVPAGSHVQLYDNDQIDFIVRPFGSKLLIANIGGEAAKSLEQLDNRTIVYHLTDEWFRIIKHSFLCKNYRVSRSGGQYYSVPDHKIREALSKPETSNVYFAGDTCHPVWGSQLAGAYLSGQETADLLFRNIFLVKAQALAA
jgi:monoamine oxidase